MVFIVLVILSYLLIIISFYVNTYNSYAQVYFIYLFIPLHL